MDSTSVTAGGIILSRYAVHYFSAGLLSQEKLIEYSHTEAFLYANHWRPDKLKLDAVIEEQKFFKSFIGPESVRREFLRDEFTLIEYAAKYNKLKIVKRLLECGASVEEVIDSEDEHVEQVKDAWGPSVEDEDEQAKAEHANTYFLEGMCFTEYGRGYMLYALKKHCLYGSKYLLTGYWNTKANGWFFKKSEFDRLINPKTMI